MASYQEENNMTHGVAEPITEYGIPAAVSGIWKAIQALSPSNRQWLAEHLVEQSQEPTCMSKVVDDEELELLLSGLPTWDEMSHDETDELTKEDYHYAMRHTSRKAMKGIEKWL